MALIKRSDKNKMDIAIYLAQEEQKINGLIGSKRYSEAYNACKQLLLRFPEEKDLLKIKKRIENEVAEENEKIIEEKLNSLKPLWKSNSYADILKTLKELLALSPNNSKIKKLYFETQEKYQKQIEELQKDFVKQQSVRLNELLEKTPGLLLDSLFDLEKENPGNKTVLDLTGSFRDELIAKRIEEKEDLIYSNKYQDTENFIGQLKKIDSNNPRIADLERIIHGRQHQTQIVQKSEFVYAGEKHLDTLMKLKKYDKATKAAEELLSLDPNNKNVRSIFKKAQKKYFNQLHHDTIKNITKNAPTLTSEFQQDPGKFIKI